MNATWFWIPKEQRSAGGGNDLLLFFLLFLLFLLFLHLPPSSSSAVCSPSTSPIKRPFLIKNVNDYQLWTWVLPQSTFDLQTGCNCRRPVGSSGIFFGMLLDLNESELMADDRRYSFKFHGGNELWIQLKWWRRKSPFDFLLNLHSVKTSGNLFPFSSRSFSLKQNIDELISGKIPRDLFEIIGNVNGVEFVDLLELTETIECAIKFA